MEPLAESASRTRSGSAPARAVGSASRSPAPWPLPGPTWPCWPGATTALTTSPTGFAPRHDGCSPTPPMSATPPSAMTQALRRLRNAARSTFSSTTPASAPPSPASRENSEGFASVVDVDLNRMFWMAQACAPHMPPGSAIANLASVLGHVAPHLPQAPNTASKAGVIGLTRDLAQEWSGSQGHARERTVPRLLRQLEDRVGGRPAA
jgi:hypothetical protein